MNVCDGCVPPVVEGDGSVEESEQDYVNDDNISCDDEMLMMLGGISFTGVCWVEEDENDDDPDSGMATQSTKLTPGRVDPAVVKKGKKRPLTMHRTTTTTTTTNGMSYLIGQNGNENDNDDDNDVIFQNAFIVCSRGQSTTQRLPIQIVDYEDTNRGRGLVATRFIAKGEIIYTERPITATQTMLPTTSSSHDGEPVKACQTCFRSLEAWTKLTTKIQKGDAGAGDLLGLSNDVFPFPELWPVLPLEFNMYNVQEVNSSPAIRTDRYGRIQCSNCDALFCSRACYSTKIDQYGSCCIETNVRKELPGLLRETDVDDGDHEVVQAPVILAASMFLQLLHCCRMHVKSDVDGHFFHRVCGSDDDLCPLELGKRVTSDVTMNVATYTLQPLYDYIMLDLIDATEDEKHTLPLSLLHSLASKAARNGVGLTTQSPFKAYYAGLLRKTNYGGRCSETHHRHLQQLAVSLGVEKFRRGMDRDIEALVAPEIVGLFPLTTHCNHSCTPNAQIRSQEFADALIDVVATCDINFGEEVCISYIDLGGAGWGCGGSDEGGRNRRSRFQRRKELQARYMFQCECTACVVLEDD
jgi:hypothetical protein